MPSIPRPAPPTAARFYDIEGYEWGDAAWIKDEQKRDVINSPMSIYELQVGSWKMKDPENGVPYNYAELAEELIPYIKEMGYTPCGAAAHHRISV